MAKQVCQVLCKHGRTLCCHASGKVSVANDMNSIVGSVHFVHFCHGAIAATSSCEVHNDTAGLHVFDHPILDQNWALPARDGCGTDDDLTFSQLLRECFLLSFNERSRAFLGITAFSITTFLKIDGDPFCTH